MQKYHIHEHKYDLTHCWNFEDGITDYDKHL